MEGKNEEARGKLESKVGEERKRGTKSMKERRENAERVMEESRKVRAGKGGRTANDRKRKEQKRRDKRR